MPEMHLKQPGFSYSACGPFCEKFMQPGKTLFTEMSLIKLVFNMI